MKKKQLLTFLDGIILFCYARVVVNRIDTSKNFKKVSVRCSRYHYIVLWLGQCTVGRTCGATSPPTLLADPRPIPVQTHCVCVRRQQWTPPGEDGDGSPHCVGRCHSPVRLRHVRTGQGWSRKRYVTHPPMMTYMSSRSVWSAKMLAL